MAKRVIAGRRAIVTGASGGIGRQIALELARHGADLVLVARRQEPLTQVAEEITQLGGRAEAVVGDITTHATRKAAIARAVEKLGGLDILVNNAGVGAMGPFESADPDRLRRIMEVNFFALAETTRAALLLLKQGNQPIVVNLGSILGHVALPTMTEYSASKFAVRGFSDALRAELSSQGVDVLLVSPGTTKSDFFDHLIEDQGGTSWRGRKAADPAKVAQQVVRAMERGKREIIPGGKLIYYLNRLAPSLVQWGLARRN